MSRTALSPLGIGWLALLAALAGPGVLACGGGSDRVDVKNDDDDDADDGSGGAAASGGGGPGSGAAGAQAQGGGGSGGEVGSGGSGGEPGECSPGDREDCYTGPPGTLGVGLCQVGTRTCGADGTWGVCVGDVVPVPETCATPGDDDCDGSTNEEGPGCSCQKGAVQECYSGPPATKNVGPCKSGTQTCKDDGTGWGPCMGEVVPAPESCLTAGDEDCDGQVNEEGTGCVCAPSSTQSCYSGPPGTQGVGICKAGTKTCNAQGTAWGPCVGEILPAAENCMTPADENCDGQAPPCQQQQAIIDLRADVNRNGTVDLADPSEDANETTWDDTHGAIFLANIDDDQNACPTANQSDAQLAACHDADPTDDFVNGPDDLLDLARLKTVPWPQAPADAKGTISLSPASAASKVRLFKKVGANFQYFDPSTGQISSSELQSGVEFAIEARDVVRDPAVWNGFVDVTFNVDAGTGPNGPIPDGSDTVKLRVAPIIFRHHLHPATKVYVTSIASQASIDFRNDLNAACSAAGLPNATTFSVNDQWTQDFFETAYMSMPAPNGQQHIIHVNIRSANYTNGLRAAGKVVYTVLRGKDAAGLTQYDANHPNFMDTLNSFGNLETIPPFSFGGQSWPLGRVLRGSTPSFYPDTSFDAMIQAQGYQDIVYIDTEWLLVAHVDETVSFIKASSPRGWVMLANDPTLAKTMLQQAQQSGFGNTQMFVGKFWSGNVPATVTINQVLADPDVMNESAWAAVKVAEQIDVIKAATGLTDGEIVKVPFLHETSSGYSVAYQPGTVNGIYLSDTHFGAPKPYGPVIGGQDIFKQQLANALAVYGVTVDWIEDWDLYHRLLGEVHCGSNVTRTVPANVKWWESDL